MLEWYETGADCDKLIDFTKNMLIHLAENLFGSTYITYRGKKISLDTDWLILTVKEAFAEFAEISAEQAIKDGIFDQVLVEKIEPKIALSSVPVILKDYPAEFAALSKLNDKNPAVAERWELYIAGIELANTYTELINPVENRKRFAGFAEARKRNGLSEIPLNDNFFTALENGMPESAGCALGIDRLCMILNNKTSI